MDDKAGCGVSIAAIILIIIALVAIESTATKTSSTVETVAHNTAHLEAGEVMVVTHQVGKSRQVWHITYDGKDEVKLECIGCPDKHATLSGRGVRVEVDLGWLSPSFYVTRSLDSGVDIRWPDGWRLRR